MYTKKYLGFFFIFSRSCAISQNQKRPGFYTLTETRFINNSGSNQNKKNPDHDFVDIDK